MIESIYQILAKIGYTHPLHPPFTHLPAGLIIGAFIFALLAWIFNRKSLAQTARHCMVLSLVTAVPTVLLGLMDWQHRFGGAYLFEIKMKMVFTGILLFLLLVAVVFAALSGTFTRTVVAIYALCLLTVIGLGYFGGELVYGTKTAPKAEATGLAAQGALVFKQNCSACHFPDRKDRKVGPGLLGLFKRSTLPDSGLPVSEETVSNQIINGGKKMPPFGHLKEEEIKAIIDYLKSL
jgi:mono/diheme cytochrome c family protein